MGVGWVCQLGRESLKAELLGSVLCRTLLQGLHAHFVVFHHDPYGHKRVSPAHLSA